MTESDGRSAEPAEPVEAAPGAGATVRVLIVDDDPLVRAGLQLIVGGDKALVVVGEANDGQAAVLAVQTLAPDVVLMDIRMPRLDGVAATGQITELHGDAVRVLVLTTFDADELVVQALRAGASGFLLKDTPPARIVAAIRSVASGEPILSPAALDSLLAQVGRGDAHAVAPAGHGDLMDRARQAQELLATLTERELEVAQAVGAGLSNAEISQSLYLSVATVKAHVSRLLTKLDCTNRVQIALLVHDAGLTQ